MKKNNLTVTTALLAKTLLLSFLLLSATFIAGLIIGKNEPSFDKNRSKEESQLSACSFKLQEISSKYLSLMEFAQTKGIVTADGKTDNNVICTYIVNDEDTAEDVLEETPETAAKEGVEKDAQKNCRFSIQLLSDTNKNSVVAVQKKYNIPETFIVEGVVDEKSWYRLRYGCFETRADAERELPQIRETVVNALVVTN